MLPATKMQGWDIQKNIFTDGMPFFDSGTQHLLQKNAEKLSFY